MLKRTQDHIMTLSEFRKQTPKFSNRLKERKFAKYLASKVGWVESLHPNGNQVAQECWVSRNPSITGSNGDSVGGLERGKMWRETFEFHKQQHLSLSTGCQETKDRSKLSEFIYHAIFTSCKHARACLIYTSHISVISFSITVISETKAGEIPLFDHTVPKLAEKPSLFSLGEGWGWG